MMLSMAGLSRTTWLKKSVRGVTSVGCEGRTTLSEEYHRTPGHSVNLQYRPVRGLSYIKTAGIAGLKLHGLPRGDIAVALAARGFTCGVRKRKLEK